MTFRENIGHSDDSRSKGCDERSFVRVLRGQTVSRGHHYLQALTRRAVNQCEGKRPELWQKTTIGSRVKIPNDPYQFLTTALQHSSPTIASDLVPRDLRLFPKLQSAPNGKYGRNDNRRRTMLTHRETVSKKRVEREYCCSIATLNRSGVG